MPSPDYSATMNNPIYGSGTTTAYTGTAGNCAVLSPNCQAVFVWCSTAAHIKVGVTAVATVDVDMAIPAGIPIVLPVNIPLSRVSAVQVTGGSGGNLYVMQLLS